MLYFLGALVAVISAGFFLSGTNSLTRKDEHAVNHSIDDAIAHHQLSQMHQNQHHNF